MNSFRSSSADNRGFSLVELLVSIFILSMFIFIFIQFAYIVKNQNELLTSTSDKPSHTFQVMIAILHDIHLAHRANLQGPHGIILHQPDHKITWITVNGRIVRKVDSITMIDIPGSRLEFETHDNQTITVSSSERPLSVTGYLGGAL